MCSANSKCTLGRLVPNKPEIECILSLPDSCKYFEANYRTADEYIVISTLDTSKLMKEWEFVLNDYYEGKWKRLGEG